MRTIAALFCVLLLLQLPGQVKRNYDFPVRVIEKPVPTCVEPETVKELVLVGKVEEDLDSDEFLIQPWSLTVDGNGNIYVYDLKAHKVFQYNKDMRFVRTIGREGQGPGEFGGGPGRGLNLYIGPDNLLYIADRVHMRISAFTSEGKYVRDLKVQRGYNTWMGMVTDGKGNYFLHGDPRGAIAVFNSEGKWVRGLIGPEDMRRSLFFRFPGANHSRYLYPHPTGLFYDFIGENRMFAFSAVSGVLYLIDNFQVRKRINIWPRDTLDLYKRRLAEDIKVGAARLMFRDGFIDYDTRNVFYITSNGLWGKDQKPANWCHFYQFNWEGKLLDLYRVPYSSAHGAPGFEFKKNGLFYAIQYKADSQTIAVYKEKNK